MLKVGLVGVGGISGAHIPAWEAMQDTELVALCDIRPERLKPYPGKNHYLNFDEMLDSEKLDILDICLPTYLHVDFAVRAMEKGIHVICEKPISLHDEDIERAYSTAHRMHVNFMVAQVLRFWPEYEFVKEAYETRKYGRLLSGCMARLGGYPKWSWDGWMMDEKRSGMVPYDLHIHDLDFIVYAFGTPENVTRNRARTPQQDYISATYAFPDFFIHTEASWYAAPLPFAASFRFQFEDALLLWERGKCMVYQNDGQILDLSSDSQGETGSINLPKSDAYANEIRYFTDCVQKGCFPDKIKPEELETVVRLLNAF